jgi:hypothetical protein
MKLTIHTTATIHVASHVAAGPKATAPTTEDPR